MKRLIICCDGTWNSADQVKNGELAPTNVLRIASRVAKRDGPVPQIVYYDQGVGTGNVLDRLTGGAFGHGLEDNIHDAYRFLVGNYEAGDELFLFGFSRGAFTVRSITGMIRKCGILRRDVVTRYPEALTLYRDAQRPDDPGPTGFRDRYSVTGTGDIPVKLIGVWDTVGSLGIPLRGLRWLTRSQYQFHDTELSGTVAHAYHALAVDEHRAPFEPALWQHKPKPPQVVEQVWFAGVHSDVGGGYGRSGATDITLGWMLDKARGADLALDGPTISAYPLSPDPVAPLHDSKTGLYRLTRGIDRPIGLTARDPKKPRAPRRPDPTQSVHSSVRDRWDKDPKYRPAALREFFARTGDDRAQHP